MFVLYQHFHFYAIYKIKINKITMLMPFTMYKTLHKTTKLCMSHKVKL
ncbi:hypothetical protein bcere0028_38500 [Bacillus cereus AH1271]|nr:hypothetical protein bcere0028_38500 [Bacillus cereus AH1271]